MVTLNSPTLSLLSISDLLILLPQAELLLKLHRELPQPRDIDALLWNQVFVLLALFALKFLHVPHSLPQDTNRLSDLALLTDHLAQ